MSDDNEKEALDSLEQFFILKAGWDEIEHPRLKRERATHLFTAAIRIARIACGEDLLRSVYGISDAPDRRSALNLIAGRVRLASWVFLPFDDEANSLPTVAMELQAIAAGDTPDLFSNLPGRRSAQRVLNAKFDAVRWEAYLLGLGEKTSERHSAIAEAYAQEWDTISRWRKAAEKNWGHEPVSFRLGRDESDGRRGLRRWSMKPGEHWRSALARSGEMFRATCRRHAELST